MDDQTHKQTNEFIQWFRDSSPYIHAHRGHTFVVMISGEQILEPGFNNLVHDIALLNSLGIKLVLVHGARPQIESSLQRRGTETRFHQHLRITDEAALNCVKEASGQIRVEIEALLSQGLINTPMAGARIRVASGNFVTAQPIGVRDGVDFKHTGKVRRIDTDALRERLQSDNIVLLSPLGYSPSGEIFNLSAEELAATVSTALKADKLLYLVHNQGLTDKHGKLVRQISTRNAKLLRENNTHLDQESLRYLDNAITASDNGVKRVHLIDRSIDGALLIELFTRDGFGTLISAEAFDHIRMAKVDDVAGIIELIQPLEEAGVLVKRSRETLETEINHFMVIERDGMIIGCASLYPYTGEQVGEFACLTVHPAYQHQGHGERLLKELQAHARALEIHTIFCLTTVSAHWFIEQGFIEGSIDELPVERQAMYNWQRNSKVFVKSI